MKRMPLLKVWRILSGWKVEVAARRNHEARSSLAIRPLPVAVRVDTALKTGTNGFIPASKLIWVSPGREDLPVKTLQTMLLPN
jgi:hypothetical protein